MAMKSLDHPDYSRARRYALERLAREIPANLVYHNCDHTRRVVLPAVLWLCSAEAVTAEERMLALTAACFHDLGWIQGPEDHEQRSAAIAAQALQVFNYRRSQIQTVQELILATRLPHSPQGRLEEILIDADMDVLGRRDFWRQNAALRTELENLGKGCSDIAWYTEQVRFMEAHRYYTPSARRRRNDWKARNLARVVRRLAFLEEAENISAPAGR